MDILFPITEYWWFYLCFTLSVIVLLAIDLGVFHRTARAVSFKEASVWIVVWVSLALIFNWLFYQYLLWKFPADPGIARRAALEFLAGYIVEESLSLDNMFVFVLVFNFFNIPRMYQHRVLFYGILGALIFRGSFIAAGALLLRFEWVVWLFGGFLVLTGIKMAFAPEKKLEPDKNPVIKLFRRFVPVTPEMHGKRFFIRLNGVLHATPLFVTLLFVEVSDVIFAIDSVPAIFALTREPMIVFTSNVFAILGLRAMYFLLAGAAEKFHLLKYAFAIVLTFVGLKMVWLNRLYDGHFPIGWSLGIIAGSIAGAILASLLFPPRESEQPGL